MLDRFEREYQDYHKLSAGRRHEQSIVLRQLEDHAGKPLDECDADDVKQYLGSMLESGNHVNTIRKKLGMLKPYFGWAFEARLIDSDQYVRIDRLGAPSGATGNGLPRPYSRKELTKFFAEFDKRWPVVDEKYWARWRRGTSRFRRIQPHAMRIQIEAIVALALHCGLRRQEIYLASIDDIHYDNAYVVVRHGKGGKEREVPHTRTSREAVYRWLELRAELKPKKSNKSPWLCLAWESIALQPMRWDRFRKLLGTIPSGPDKGRWQLHRFRHTCGTEWLRAIKRIEIVSKLLGHSRIQQTQGYAKIVRDDLHEAVAKAEREFEERVAA